MCFFCLASIEEEQEQRLPELQELQFLELSVRMAEVQEAALVRYERAVARMEAREAAMSFLARFDRWWFSRWWPTAAFIGSMWSLFFVYAYRSR